MTPERPFLTAGWRYLAVLNYEVPPALLEPHVPAGTVLDDWQGRTRQRDGGTVEYRVAHPSWTVAAAGSAELRGDLAALYGPALAEVLEGTPASAFLATGSPVTVFQPVRLRLARSAG